MTLCAVGFPPTSDAIDDAEVVNELPYGLEFLAQAVALWRLVDPSRAAAIEVIKRRACNAPGDYIRFQLDDVGEVADLIGDVDETLVAAGIVDANWHIDPARLEGLVERVPGLSPASARPTNVRPDGVLVEVISNAVSVRSFFADAKRDGCVVIHD